MIVALITAGLLLPCPPQDGPRLKVNDREYFEARGVNVLVFSNRYDGLFSDAKMSAVEIIHHGVRTATNGDVRLSPTPEQWDPTPQLVDRKVDVAKGRIDAVLEYPSQGLSYTIRTQAEGDGVTISIILDQPLPRNLEGRAGFNLEFLPSAYFKKTYLIDEHPGVFPISPGGPMQIDASGSTEALPIARGKMLVLSPEDASTHVTIRATIGTLSLYDGRNKAQNGWYVLRTELPPGKTGTVVEWHVTPHAIPGWTRTPMIAHSQVGYTPRSNKVAVIELDPNDTVRPEARLLQVQPNGDLAERHRAEPVEWGGYLRYHYVTFDFSAVQGPGLYVIEYGSVRTKPFPISQDVYANAWQPTLDVFFPVQMDHMFVNEAYRVWHGASHLDDALQAPVNHEHFDLYAQGPTTDTPFKPGEHIPGLNVGGWFDAGDYDIRTQSQSATVLTMVQTWETFGLRRDETTIDQHRRSVEIHRPDGRPDLLQQIEHGTLQLLGQYRAVGHAIPGIVEAHLSQYTHLGDAVTKTDNLIYDPAMDSLESDGRSSGVFDDRWAFTSRTTPLNYGSVAALAAASRAMKGYNDTLATECLKTASRVWTEEHSHPPFLFRHGNTTGGPLADEELKAAVELLLATKDRTYARRVEELWPQVDETVRRMAATAVRALPFLDASFTKRAEEQARTYATRVDELQRQNPFGVPITTGGWAGSGLVVGSAVSHYILHKTFPDIITPDYTLRALSYIYGCHPGSDLSLVSGVGVESKMIAYGSNRADYSFIAGGVVPGVLILRPDFPENKEDWPFLWGENEYVIPLAASYIFLANAADELAGRR